MARARFYQTEGSMVSEASVGDLAFLTQRINGGVIAWFGVLAVFCLGCAPETTTSSIRRSKPVLMEATSSRKALAPAASKFTGHDRMVAKLQELHRRNQNNPFFEGALLQAQRRYMMSKQSPDPRAMMSALYALGTELTRRGDADQALEKLAELDDVMRLVRKRYPKAISHEMAVSADLAGALAGIRKGENENCIHCLGGDGCLFPIRPSAVHRKKEGSQIALKYLDRTLQKDPENLTAIWLLNLAHMTLGTHPSGVPERYRLPPDTLRPVTDFPRFPNISSKLGIDTLSHAGGVVVEDMDGDLDMDIFVSSWATDGQCRYYRNEGDAGFQDKTDEVGLRGIVGGLNVRPIDFDNDGDTDILILRGAWLQQFGKHPNSLLRNDDGKRFVDVAYQAKVAGEDWPTQAAAIADYDLDGDLDVFIGNEREPDQLLRNDGGSFTDVAAELGLNDKGFAKGACWGDIDNDGDPDLFVSVMGAANILYRNDGQEGFQRVVGTWVAEPGESFSCWFFDYNNDGNLDLFVAAYDEGIDQVAADYFGQPLENSDHDHLFAGDGRGNFRDVSREVGLGRISQTMGSNFGDLNNDGFLDFYLATGSPAIDALQPNLMYLNRNGKDFVDVSIAGGFSHLQKGHAISFVDLDHDGDQDVFAELGGAYLGDAFYNALFENPGFAAPSIKLILVGVTGAPTAVGARVELVLEKGGTRRNVFRTVDCGSSFGSNPLRLHIGLGDAEAIREARIRWPGVDDEEVFRGLAAGKCYRIVEASGTPEPVSLPPIDWRLHGSEASADSEADAESSDAVVPTSSK
ncbi:MAG: CRTAC1 family protein [Planctomycetota bacterium]